MNIQIFQKDLDYATLDTVPQPVVIYDLERSVLWVNRFFTEQSGQSLESLVGSNCTDLFNLEEKCDHCPVTQTILSQTSSQAEMNLPLSDLSLQSNTSPIFDEDQKLTAVLAVISDFSQIKKREQIQKDELERSRYKTAMHLKRAIRASNIGFWEWDLDSGQGSFSKEWKEHIGYKEEEIGNKFNEWKDRIHPDELPETLAKLEDIKNGTVKHIDMEYRFRHRDGSYRWMYAQVSTHSEEVLDSTRVIFIHVDITEQKKAREALELSEEKYRALFENAPQAYQSLDINGCFKDINPGWCRVLGYDRDEVIGRNFSEFLHSDWKPHFEKNFPAFKKRGYVKDVQFKMRHKNGNFIFVEFNGCIGYHPDGSFRQTYCVFQDITQRKLAEDLLKEERIRLSNIIKGTNVGTWEWNVQTGEATINKRMANIAGYSLDELEPVSFETLNRLCHPDDRDAFAVTIDRHLSGETEFFELEFRIIHKNGTSVWVFNKGQVISTTKDGKPLLMMGTQLDISERKQMQERLQITEKMDAIGQLAGGIAHDFNNQLGGILGYADILMENLKEPQLKGYAESIITASRRAAELTSQLLAFGRKGKNLNEPVNIHQEISEVVQILERSIDKRIHIKLNLKASPSKTHGDPSQLNNALLNLGLNARDAITASGSITYSTDTCYLEERDVEHWGVGIQPGNYIRIAVSDTGCGMDEGVRRKIFEPFYTTKEKGKGTGLGLSSVYGTITNHGGTISVYSEQGKGSTFNIYLPVCESDQQHTDQRKTGIRKGTGRILIVDDEEILRKMSQAMLQEMGYETLACSSGSDALKLYKDQWQKIDLVILDMIMPGMDGKTTFKKLKEVNPHIRVIVSSGYSLNESVQSIIDQGGAAFLAKPFNLWKLSNAVASVLMYKRQYP